MPFAFYPQRSAHKGSPLLSDTAQHYPSKGWRSSALPGAPHTKGLSPPSTCSRGIPHPTNCNKMLYRRKVSYFCRKGTTANSKIQSPNEEVERTRPKDPAPTDRERSCPPTQRGRRGEQLALLRQSAPAAHDREWHHHWTEVPRQPQDARLQHLHLRRRSPGARIALQGGSIPEIVECHYTTGPYTLLIKLYATDNNDLMRILNGTIQEIPGVTATETLISLDVSFERSIHIPNQPPQ